MFARTSDSLVRAAFSSKKLFIVIDLRSYHEFDSLKHQFELKGLILRLKTLWTLENTFSKKLRNEPVMRFYEKNQVLFEIRPSYDGVPEPSTCLTDGQSSCMVSLNWRHVFVGSATKELGGLRYSYLSK